MLSSDPTTAVPWVAIQRNPKSGSGRARGELRRLIRQLKARGLRPRMFSDRRRMDRALAAAECDPVAVVSAGGDGTVGSVFGRFPNLPIAILPLGTENLIARYLGIARDGQAVADMIAAGKQRVLDSGWVNGQRFLIMAGFGLDAAVVHRMDQVRTGTISHLSYIQPIARSLRKYRYRPIRVWLDDAADPIVGAQVLIVNLPAYALGLPFAADARGDDGILDVRVFEKGSRFQMLKYCYKVSRRQHEAMPDVFCGTARRVRIEADEAVPAQVDGDPAGTTPAEIRVEPGTVCYLVP